MGKNILVETLERLKMLYARDGLEPGTLKKIAVKPQWNAIVGTHEQCGIAINFTGIHDVYEGLGVDAQSYSRFVGKSLFEVAEENIVGGGMSQRSLGVAALCALSQPLLSSKSLATRGLRVQTESSGSGSFVSPTDVVAVVGYGGMVRSLIGKCKAVHVTEMRPREQFQNVIIGETVEYGPKAVSVHSEAENKDVLGKADVVFITGSSLVNGTFGDLISYCDRARWAGLYGPSASFIPDVLFEWGVDFVLSTRITDPERFEYDAMNDLDMEFALKHFQSRQVIWGNEPLPEGPR